MKQLTCEMCGSTDLIKQDGVFVCQTCGCKYSIEEAKKMLIENMDFPINIIGELAGFSDRSNFHRQFVKSTGCSPKHWRESGGKP